MRKKIDHLILINAFWILVIMIYLITFIDILVLVNIIGPALTIVYEIKLYQDIQGVLNSKIRKRMENQVEYQIILSATITLAALAYLYRII